MLLAANSALPMQMLKLATLVTILFVTSGCEIIWTAPPASGRVLDSRSQRPIEGATVTRIAASGATTQTTSDPEGQFKLRGKRSIQVFPFGDATAWATYRIEAIGYEMVETNRHGYGSVNGLRHDFREILLPQKPLTGDSDQLPK